MVSFYELEEGKAYKVLPEPKAWYSFNIEATLQTSQAPFLVVKREYKPGEFGYNDTIRIRYASIPGGLLDTYGYITHRNKLMKTDPQPEFEEVPLNSIKEASAIQPKPRYILDTDDFFKDLHARFPLDTIEAFGSVLRQAKGSNRYMREEFDVPDETSLRFDIRDTPSSGIKAVTVKVTEDGTIDFTFNPAVGNPFDTPARKEKLTWIFEHYVVDTYENVKEIETTVKNTLNKASSIPANVQAYISSYLTGHKKPVSNVFWKGGSTRRKSRKTKKTLRRRRRR